MCSKFGDNYLPFVRELLFHLAAIRVLVYMIDGSETSMSELHYRRLCHGSLKRTMRLTEFSSGVPKKI